MKTKKVFNGKLHLWDKEKLLFDIISLTKKGVEVVITSNWTLLNNLVIEQYTSD